MKKNLVIVESPAKAKTIEKYLGSDFKVVASMGHVRDLPKSTLGINIEGSYGADYATIKGKGAVISKMKGLVPDNGTVYLAQDLDREGEAIAWHVGQALGLFDERGKKKKIRGKEVDYKRVVFSEITKDAIVNAVKNPRGLDLNLVDAQQARRILDRLVGYKLSPLLWKKIRYGLSAGRVQSVAVRLIVDRERERDAFEPVEYWELLAHLYKNKSSESVAFELVKQGGKKIELKDCSAVDKVKKVLKGTGDWKVKSVEEKTISKNPPAPFTTSTLQQSAFNKLGYSSKRTMAIAQGLYQGIDLSNGDHKALITYMRTDSKNLSNESVSAIRSVIINQFGKENLEQKPRVYKTKSKSAQEAHEAIRPTDVAFTPSDAAKVLPKDELNLYQLIWQRTVACQMVPAQYKRLTIDVEKLDFIFRNSNQSLVSPGYLSVYHRGLDKEPVLDFSTGDILKLKDIESTQHFTQPPARYNEASLVKALESYGIGRPSTYSAIISTILQRGYVVQENKALKPEDIGYVVTDLLKNHFPEIVDVNFTSGMEEDLDAVARGEKEWVPVIDAFYKPFEKLLEKKDKEINKEDVVVLEESDEVCEKCGAKMVVKLGRFGKFLSCTKFPECKGMKSLAADEDLEKILENHEKPEKCDKCGEDMELKRGKYGLFWACKKYPDCKSAKPLLLKEKCPECGSNLLERTGKWGKSFIGCSGYPNCKYIQKTKKTVE